MPDEQAFEECLRAFVTTIAEANKTLADLKADRIGSTGVLAMR